MSPLKNEWVEQKFGSFLKLLTILTFRKFFFTWDSDMTLVANEIKIKHNLISNKLHLMKRESFFSLVLDTIACSVH